MSPLASAPVVSGPLWSIVLPALLFVFALTCTALLYRHFARPERKDG